MSAGNYESFDERIAKENAERVRKNAEELQALRDAKKQIIAETKERQHQECEQRQADERTRRAEQTKQYQEAQFAREAMPLDEMDRGQFERAKQRFISSLRK